MSRFTTFRRAMTAAFLAAAVLAVSAAQALASTNSGPFPK